MKRFHESSEKLHNVLYFLSGAMAVILVLIIVVGVQTKAQNGGYDTNENGASDVQEPAQVAGTVTQSTEKPEKWQEGTVTYKGKDYRYNSNLRVFLMMGIDNDDLVATASDYTNGGQSDAMFLLVVDSLNQKLQVISINRNTMTDIKLCDKEGYSMGTIQGQICLQHAFGDAKRISCQRSVDAVADLFGNIPISGYLAMNMGAIPTMNDAVGGVKVKVLQNIYYPDYNVKLHKGDKVTLNGQEAYYYLRGRDVQKYDSASDRLRREEQYIVAYMDRLKALTADDPSIVMGVYNSIEDYLVTSVDFSSLINELMSYDFNDDDMYTVPGKTVQGDEYEEYHVDEDAMQDMIMSVFYTPVS